MSVKVKLPLFFWRDLAGGKEQVESVGHTVGECLENLESQFPGIKQRLCDEQERLLPYYEIFVNSKDAYPEELAKPVKDGDVITVVVLLDGG
jgi:molybdopterin synthase sulfur carrier subunit